MFLEALLINSVETEDLVRVTVIYRLVEILDGMEMLEPENLTLERANAGNLESEPFPNFRTLL